MKRNVLHATISDRGRVIFSGMDWGEKRAASAGQCPRCNTLHCWKTRAPRRCRGCKTKFLYTASVADASALTPAERCDGAGDLEHLDGMLEDRERGEE